MYHSLYAVAKNNNDVNTGNLVKLVVEEFYDMGTNSIKKKAYHLRAIKIEPADGRSEGNPSTAPRSDTNSIKSVSDLFSLVKIYDKDFII